MYDPFERPIERLKFEFHNIPDTEEQCGYVIAQYLKQCPKCGWERDE